MTKTIFKDDLDKIIKPLVKNKQLIVPKSYLCKTLKISYKTLYKILREHDYDYLIGEQPERLVGKSKGRPKKIVPDESGKYIHPKEEQKHNQEPEKELTKEKKKLDDIFKSHQ